MANAALTDAELCKSRKRRTMDWGREPNLMLTDLVSCCPIVQTLLCPPQLISMVAGGEATAALTRVITGVPGTAALFATLAIDEELDSVPFAALSDWLPGTVTFTFSCVVSTGVAVLSLPGSRVARDDPALLTLVANAVVNAVELLIFEAIEDATVGSVLVMA
jgi:hypothetical protein